MGQGEIFQFLKENEGQIFTAKEISMALNMSSAVNLLSKLRRYPPEGFNSSKEHRLYNLKKGGKTIYHGYEIYSYWYKKRDHN